MESEDDKKEEHGDQNQRVLFNLRGIMVAMLVESGHVQRDIRRHELTPSLPVDAQQAIVDEIMRQHRDLKNEIEEGDPELREHLSSAVRGPLFQLRVGPRLGSGNDVRERLTRTITRRRIPSDFLLFPRFVQGLCRG